MDSFHHIFKQGGEQDGRLILTDEIALCLLDALQTQLYKNVRPKAHSLNPDRAFSTNASFWAEALAGRQFPTQYIVLEDFVLMEWLPFAPGRYYTPNAESTRLMAESYLSPTGNEYLPTGKFSMVSGGIGSIRLAGRHIQGSTRYFLGASSTGIAHQGIPIALSSDEYRKVIPIIKDKGGCRARIIGSLQTLTENMPNLQYDLRVPRYCFIAEEVNSVAPVRGDLLTTVAVMFATEASLHRRWNIGCENDSRVLNKSWTFCSFRPSSSGQEVVNAAKWLIDYAVRYSHGEPSLLTDFDEQFSLFPCSVEFPLSAIVDGSVDWENLNVYRNRFRGTYIENYFKEYTHVEGDKITVKGSHNIIVNRSMMMDALKNVKIKNSEEVANALLQVEKEINRSGNLAAVENFDSFNEELSKAQPKKSLLKTLWGGTLEVLPAIKELPGVVDSITKLFN